jgi:hypothetical protein
MELGVRRLVRALDAFLAAALLVLMLLGLYLAGEDPLFAGHLSRWSMHSGDPGSKAAFWSAVALTAVAVLSLGHAARSGRISHALGATLVGTLALGATALAFVAFTG